MAAETNFLVVESSTLSWPSTLHIPSKRFRLFVAADVSSAPVEIISEFARAALRRGMVYFCAWGPDCERFHDIVDELIVEDRLGDRLFVGTNRSDTIMTTWHDAESLDEALDFFINLAHPTEGFGADSGYWVALSLNHPEWTATLQRTLAQAELRF